MRPWLIQIEPQAYEAMWNDVSRQFLRHTDAVVLREVLILMRKMNSATSLEVTNQEKFDQLKESLSTALHETLGDRDLAGDSLEDEDVQNIESGLLRVKTLMSQYNVEALFAVNEPESDEADMFDVILALSSRGQLGYRPEIKVRDSGVRCDETRDLALYAALSGGTIRHVYSLASSVVDDEGLEAGDSPK
jgi:cohesin complex subunit SA-1/2